jgi:hypothetical protein
MVRTNKIIVRLTDTQKEKIQRESVRIGVSMTEIVQDWIKSLPD